MRKSQLKRSGAPKKTNPARRRKAFAFAYGSKEYVVWCQEQPCIACGIVGFSEVAHIKTGGIGLKDNWTRTVPLCGPHPLAHALSPGCHNLLHGWGKRDFESIKRLDLVEEAEENQIAWLSSLGSSPGEEK